MILTDPLIIARPVAYDSPTRANARHFRVVDSGPSRTSKRFRTDQQARTRQSSQGRPDTGSQASIHRAGTLSKSHVLESRLLVTLLPPGRCAGRRRDAGHDEHRQQPHSTRPSVNARSRERVQTSLSVVAVRLRTHS